MLGGFGVLGPCKEDIGIFRDTWGYMGMYSDTCIYIYIHIHIYIYRGFTGIEKGMSGFRF